MSQTNKDFTMNDLTSIMQNKAFLLVVFKIYFVYFWIRQVFFFFFVFPNFEIILIYFNPIKPKSGGRGLSPHQILINSSRTTKATALKLSDYYIISWTFWLVIILRTDLYLKSIVIPSILLKKESDQRNGYKIYKVFTDL